MSHARDTFVQRIRNGITDKAIARDVVTHLIGSTNGTPIFRHRWCAALINGGVHDSLIEFGEGDTIEQRIANGRHLDMEGGATIPVHRYPTGEIIGSTAPFSRNGVVIGYIFTPSKLTARRQKASWAGTADVV
jgi:hypothetical protein